MNFKKITSLILAIVLTFSLVSNTLCSAEILDQPQTYSESTSKYEPNELNIYNKIAIPTFVGTWCIMMILHYCVQYRNVDYPYTKQVN